MTAALYAEDEGEGECALVLLHGFAGSHRIWERVRRALPTGLRILAYDLPGHGRSIDCAGAGKAKATAQAIVDDLETRRIGRCHMAGHSFGGAIAVLSAHLAPRTVASLALLAPGGFGREIAGDLMMARAQASTDAEIASAMQDMFGAHSPISPETVAEAIALNAVAGQREKLIEISGVIVRDGEQGAFPAGMLEELMMPVHLVWGTLDAVLPPRQAAHAPSSFTLHHLEGAGHMLPEERPEAVARIIARSIGAV
ncbi:alpha/beta fold hydrolase [Nitratireductor kimnyeongensis]|uniref:Alpha/beta fold hydrolase n=1 Tax=Nitratireductor kimnyeongensis TaxID=430679 RepID=A0ABW0T9G2_9HYPH|nr:alpha/beta fold hydrolase [Nitratireductor kimnyeongensis]QZZ36121.1 alpha/beta fold hydrolase [Nitratireductor kimnyeongensis]